MTDRTVEDRAQAAAKNLDGAGGKHDRSNARTIAVEFQELQDENDRLRQKLKLAITFVPEPKYMTGFRAGEKSQYESPEDIRNVCRLRGVMIPDHLQEGTDDA